MKLFDNYEIVLLYFTCICCVSKEEDNKKKGKTVDTRTARKINEKNGEKKGAERYKVALISDVGGRPQEEVANKVNVECKWSSKL